MQSRCSTASHHPGARRQLLWCRSGVPRLQQTTGRCPPAPFHGGDGPVAAVDMELQPSVSPPCSPPFLWPGAGPGPRQHGGSGDPAWDRAGTWGWVGWAGSVAFGHPSGTASWPLLPRGPLGGVGMPRSIAQHRAALPRRRKRCPDGTLFSDLCNYSCPIFLHVFF